MPSTVTNPCVGSLEAQEAPDQGRLAGTIGADQRGDPAPRDVEVDPIECGWSAPPIALGEVLGTQACSRRSRAVGSWRQSSRHHPVGRRDLGEFGRSRGRTLGIPLHRVRGGGWYRSGRMESRTRWSALIVGAVYVGTGVLGWLRLEPGQVGVVPSQLILLGIWAAIAILAIGFARPDVFGLTSRETGPWLALALAAPLAMLSLRGGGSPSTQLLIVLWPLSVLPLGIALGGSPSRPDRTWMIAGALTGVAIAWGMPGLPRRRAEHRARHHRDRRHHGHRTGARAHCRWSEARARPVARLAGAARTRPARGGLGAGGPIRRACRARGWPVRNRSGEPRHVAAPSRRRRAKP